jgi:hypothetical protein
VEETGVVINDPFTDDLSEIIPLNPSVIETFLNGAWIHVLGISLNNPRAPRYSLGCFRLIGFETES